MRVPVREREDSDTVLSASLADVPRLVKALRAVLARAGEGLATVRFIAGDGHPSVAVRDNDEVLDSIRDAITEALGGQA